ncbi:MAG: tyrosine-type recombinase/integrase [Hydrogenoanaerobacterium sp.]
MLDDEHFKVVKYFSNSKEVTVQKYLVAISAALSDAKRNEIIPKNPALIVELLPAEKTVQLIPTDAEIKALMNALLDEPEHYRYYYFLAIYTGCRRGELCALKWSDFQIINDIPTLTVRHNNTGGSRKLKQQLKSIKKDDGYVFAQPNGKAMLPSSFTYRLKLICKKHNLEGVNMRAIQNTVKGYGNGKH